MFQAKFTNAGFWAEEQNSRRVVFCSMGGGGGGGFAMEAMLPQLVLLSTMVH